MAHVEDRWKAEPERRRTGRRWRVRYRDAAHRHHSRSFDRQVDADRFAREVGRDLDLGTYIDPNAGRITFSAYAARWLANANNLRETTFVSYEAIIRNHLDPMLGATPIAHLRPDDFHELIRHRRAAGSSDGTIRKIVRLAKTILANAVSDRLVAINPVDSVRLPKEAEREVRFLTAGQLAELVAATHPHYRTLVLTAGITGARSGELRGLHPRSLNLLRNEMHIVEQLVEVRGELKVLSPKTKASVRRLALPRFLVAELERQLSERSTTELVFPTPTGDPIRKSNFTRRIWKPAVEASGLGYLTFHELRHTAVALAIEVGAHPKAIQERFGHSSITVTLDRYGHLFPSLDEALADNFDRSFGETLAPPARPETAG